MQVKVLVLNSGSSSLKFQVLAMPEETRICQGLVERIGTGEAAMHFTSDRTKFNRRITAGTHKEALEHIVVTLLDRQSGVLKSTAEIAAVGHRVVHGGDLFSETTRIDKRVMEAIDTLSRLAPLHNPHNLEGIKQAEMRFPNALQVAVFDTAFHRTIPQQARRYALPKNLFSESGIQLYGFHGTSHKFVSEQVTPFLPKPGKLITLHLGNGCSATAILDGKSIDHSLGFTPTGGLVMGTRSGDLDPGILLFLIQNLGYSPETVERLITSKSGLLGLTGFSDMRDVEREAAAGNPDCILALEITSYRIRKYIGAYTAAMNGLDGLVFTGGIGEHSVFMRKRICSELEVLGMALDEARNQNLGSGVQEVHATHSKVQIWVVPTNEELEIARQTYALIA
jgi:acetate kinase